MQVFCIALAAFSFHLTASQYSHHVVLENDAYEALLPNHYRNHFFQIPHVRNVLARDSWFWPGEQPVYERETEKISRFQIYTVLNHAGLLLHRNTI